MEETENIFLFDQCAVGGGLDKKNRQSPALDLVPTPLLKGKIVQTRNESVRATAVRVDERKEFAVKWFFIIFIIIFESKGEEREERKGIPRGKHRVRV